MGKQRVVFVNLDFVGHGQKSQVPGTFDGASQSELVFFTNPGCPTGHNSLLGRDSNG